MNRHLLLDGALHAFQTNAELVFKQFTNSTNTSITKVIDIVRLVLRRILSHLQHIADDLVEVLRRKQWIFNAVTFGFAHLDVELQASNAREVKLARIEKHCFE